MGEYYVGLDVHSRQSVFVIEQADGTVTARGEFPTTPAGLRQLRTQHGVPAGTAVALETGTLAFYVARELMRLDLRPVVIDAHEVRLKAHRPTQKSDRRDAFELCEGLRRGIYRTIVYVPSLAISQLRETLSRRRHFVRVQTAEVNAAKRLLRAVGMGALGKSLRTAAGWEKLLAAVAADPSCGPSSRITARCGRAPPRRWPSWRGRWPVRRRRWRPMWCACRRSRAWGRSWP